MAIEIGPIRALRTSIERSWVSIRPKLPFLQREKQDTALEVKVVSDTESDEITDPLKTLSGLKEKADIMVDMIKNNQVEQPYIGRMRFRVRLWFRNLFRDGGIEGLDNLQSAIIRAREENKRLIFTPAHLADADHSAAMDLMARKNRGLGIQDELVWMGGVNMHRRPSIKKLLRAEHVIYNVTPRDANHLQTLLDKKDEFGFASEQMETLEQIQKIFNQMRAKAKERVMETCVKGKKPLVVYIEGGRSYDSLLKRPLAEFSWFFPRDDSAVVIPYRVYGSREFNPPGKDPKRILRKELLLFWLRNKVSMVVGESYPSSEVWEVFKERREDEKGDNGEKVDINPAEWPMANIANLDQRYVRPREVPLYERLMKKFAPKRNRMITPNEVVA